MGLTGAPVIESATVTACTGKAGAETVSVPDPGSLALVVDQRHPEEKVTDTDTGAVTFFIGDLEHSAAPSPSGHR